MAESLGIVVSILGIISFAGQILDGCASICTFLDSIKDANDDLRLFRTEVKLFHSLLESYRITLAEIDESSGNRWQLARLALDYSDEAVSQIQRLVKTDESDREGRWRSIVRVLRKEKFLKHLERLERAKAYIIASRNNMAFAQELKQCDLADDARKSRLAISALDSKFNATSGIMLNLSNQVLRVERDILDTKRALESKSCLVSEDLSRVSESINLKIEDEFVKVLNRIPQIQTCTARNRVRFDGHNAKNTTPDHYHTTIGMWLKHCRKTYSLTNRGGCIVFHFTSENSQETTSNSNQSNLRVRVGKPRASFKIDAIITPYLLPIGLHWSTIWRRGFSDDPGMDMRFRVYNNISISAPIIRFCEAGDIAEVQRLFSEGKASPYDRLDGTMSLLDVIFRRMVTLPLRKDLITSLKQLKQLYEVFILIIEQGADPGQIWSHVECSALPFLGIAFNSKSESWPLFLDITRTIIEKSTQDPFSGADFTELLRFLNSASTYEPRPISSLILHQEYWFPEWKINEPLTPFQYDHTPHQINPADSKYLRIWLEQGLDHREVILMLREARLRILNAVESDGLPQSYADNLFYHHIFVCVEHGVDLGDDRDGPSLAATLRDDGMPHVLRAVLLFFGWKEHEISDLIEADLMASLVYQLSHLEKRVVHTIPLPTALEFEHVSNYQWNTYLNAFRTNGSNARSSSQLSRQNPRQGGTDDEYQNSTAQEIAAQCRRPILHCVEKLERFVLRFHPFSVVLGRILNFGS